MFIQYISHPNRFLPFGWEVIHLTLSLYLFLSLSFFSLNSLGVDGVVVLEPALLGCTGLRDLKLGYAVDGKYIYKYGTCWPSG